MWAHALRQTKLTTFRARRLRTICVWQLECAWIRSTFAEVSTTFDSRRMNVRSSSEISETSVNT